MLASPLVRLFDVLTVDTNGVVKKVNGAFFKIVHERNCKSMPEGFVDAYNDSVRSINITNSDLSPHVKNNTVINPIAPTNCRAHSS